MTASIGPGAGKPAPASARIDVDQLVLAYQLRHARPSEVVGPTTGEESAGASFLRRDGSVCTIYKIYAESFAGSEHLKRILQEAQAIVDAAVTPASSP